jgi:hypothetical protein
MTQLQIVQSLARLQCTKCGAQANASCDCGEPYKPVEIAKDYARENPTASIREISAQTGVSHASAQRAKSGVSGDTPVTGRDGKKYPARRDDPETKKTTNIIPLFLRSDTSKRRLGSSRKQDQKQSPRSSPNTATIPSGKKKSAPRLSPLRMS